MTRASLQRPLSDQILSFDAVKNFCHTIKGITFFSISKDDMVPIRERLEERYKLGSTVDTTRSCHHFQPESTSAIHAKYLSVEGRFSVFHSFTVSPEEAYTRLISSLKPNDYITCQYGDHQWLALIGEVNHEEKDVFCKFMHPHGYTENFCWPARDDKAYIPFSKILMKVHIPNTS